MTTRFALPDPGRHRSWVLATALLLPLALGALLASIREETDPAFGALVLVLGVVAVAATGLRLAGFVAAVSSGFWYDVFLTRPYGTVRISEPDQVEVTVLLVLIGVAVTEIALWGRRQAALSSLRAGYLDGVLRTAELVIEGPRKSAALTDDLCRQLTDILGVESCRYLAGPPHDSRYAMLDHDGTVRRGDRAVDVELRGLPTDEYTALLVVDRGRTIGHVLITSAGRSARPTLEQRRVAVLLTDQLAPAIGA
jgi:K+-sensing histidine kinase KdpD